MVPRRETQVTGRNRSLSDKLFTTNTTRTGPLNHITPSFHTSDRTQYASIRETSLSILEREITVVKTSSVREIHE